MPTGLHVLRTGIDKKLLPAIARVGSLESQSNVHPLVLYLARVDAREAVFDLLCALSEWHATSMQQHALAESDIAELESFLWNALDQIHVRRPCNPALMQQLHTRAQLLNIMTP